jgi:hypothetical protein
MTLSLKTSSTQKKILSRRLACPVFFVSMFLAQGCDLWDIYPWQARVPIQDVGAQFTIADASWFEAEQTLFIFYEIESNQGLSDASQIELAYLTDDVDQPFIHLESLEPVHTHLDATCGDQTICGSYSVKVENAPREIGLRLRYHRDGEMTLDADVAAHLILSEKGSNSRSAIVYGVFNEENTHIQWRLRHQFPAIRNFHAQTLGLRRDLRIEDVTYGSIPDARDLLQYNPYGYALFASCPADFEAHVNGGVLLTQERAIFDKIALPLDSGEMPHACSAATVTDGLGSFTTFALAQKNPETREAFSSLQSPVTENELVHFFFKICAETTSVEHQAMQKQRLFLTESDVLCIDDYHTLDFPERLATTISEKIDDVRVVGRDMTLVIGLNRPDNEEVAEALEEALGLVLVPEAAQSSPRLSGAFVFDTHAYSIRDPEVGRYALWCPSTFGGGELDGIGDTSQRSCAVQPVTPLALGDFELSQLPILPTEEQYEDFIDEYGPSQTGRMSHMIIRSPSRTPASENVRIEDFGIGTFYNNESISAEPTDAFSYCANNDTGLVILRIEGFPDVFPLSILGDLHAAIMFERYELGLFWEFPFLLQMKYESTLAATADVPDEIPFVVGLGLNSPAEQFAGSPQWEMDSFEIGDALLQCTRFCDHPTFDSAKVYNIDDLFIQNYSNQCYRPAFPELDDRGFPVDP